MAEKGIYEKWLSTKTNDELEEIFMLSHKLLVNRVQKVMVKLEK